MFLLYWKQIAFAAITAILFLFGYYQGYSHEKKAFDTFKLQIEVQGKQQEEQNKILVKKQQQISENITKEYSDAVKKINVYYASHPNVKWVHNSSSASAVSEVPNTTKSVDGTTEVPLLANCALDVLKLKELQEWVKQNLLIGE